MILQCEAVTDIDVTAAEMLDQADQQFNAQEVHLAFVEMRARLQDLVVRYGLMDTLDKDHFYPSMDTAVAAITAIAGPSKTSRQRSPRVCPENL